jgi:hypothetical protein
MEQKQDYSPYGHPMGRMDPDTGVWTYNADPGAVEGSFDLKLAIGFALADAAVLYTVPKRVMLEELYWEIITPFAGGTASAIGASASRAPHTGKGDLLGGATGDVAATLIAGITDGTIGTSFSAAPGNVILEVGDTIRFDRIASAFTSGAGFIHASGRVIE